jgi:3-oxoacyl-[acyl-carrier protein] reductase
MRKLLGRLFRAMKAFKETFKYGGIKESNVSYLSAGSLLDGKTVLITGGGSGIGKNIAIAALEQKASVIITGRNEKKLRQTCEELNKKGDITYLVWDVTKTNEIPAQISILNERYKKGIDILVNNAGIQPKEFFPNVSEDEWNRIYDVNSKGTFFMCQEFSKYWETKHEVGKQHKIINISSQGGFVGATYPYRMSKWDIVGLTRGLGLSLIDKNIIVNSIAPGVVRTEMQEHYFRQGDNVYSDENPIKRFAFPEEIAQLAIFMMSDLSNFIVGQTIVCDGGYTLK